jgi:hypothetical protein
MKRKVNFPFAFCSLIRTFAPYKNLYYEKAGIHCFVFSVSHDCMGCTSATRIMAGDSFD